MKKEVFVLVNSENITLISEEINYKVVFAEKGIRNVTPDIMSIIIRESLDELSLSDKNIVLVPGQEFIICKEKITTEVKKQNAPDIFTGDFYNRIYSPSEIADRFIFRQGSKFIFQTKIYKSLEAIPLLQKYFINKQTCEYDGVFLSKLLSGLEENQIRIKGIVPYVSFISFDKGQKSTNCNRSIILSFAETISIATVIEDDVITKNIIINCGMKKIIEDVSNYFDLSLKTSKKLVEMYGFVFLPKEYVNYVIDIPVYGKLMQSVALTELSYHIRESLKDICNTVISSLSAKMKDYHINSEYICTYSFKNLSCSTLLDTVLNRVTTEFDNTNLKYSDMSLVFNQLSKQDNEERVKLNENNDRAEEILETQPAILDKLTNLFNSKIKPYLVDPEI